MAKEQLTYTDISDTPELLRLAEEVLRTQQARVLVKDGEELVVVSPAKPTKKARARGKPLTKVDLLFELIGISASGIPSGVSGKKHEYLVKVYREHLKK